MRVKITGAPTPGSPESFARSVVHGLMESDDLVTLTDRQRVVLNQFNNGMPPPQSYLTYWMTRTMEDANKALASAVEIGDAQTVEILIKDDPPRADVNYAASVGRTPLYITLVNGGNIYITSLLINAGADVNKSNDQGIAPLYIASRWGQLEVVKILIENGAAVNYSGKLGHNALYIASRFGHLEVVKILIENGADVEVNTMWWTPLYIAAKWGHADVVKFLLENGADVNREPRRMGDNALYIASRRHHIDVIRVLKEWIRDHA